MSITERHRRQRCYRRRWRPRLALAGPPQFWGSRLPSFFWCRRRTATATLGDVSPLQTEFYFGEEWLSEVKEAADPGIARWGILRLIPTRSRCWAWRLIAKRIIALAAKGERNPDQLCEATLAAMGILR
jgi:hypothetical protein